MNPFGIYVHWPFCAAKCPYCDFNSHVRDRIDEAEWVRLVVSELGVVARLQSKRPRVESIFFGGGTPSLMSAAATEAILAAVSRHWPVAADAEITLEANPNSVEQNRFRGYRAAGVNRVSIGVQSFDETALKSLGRLHSAGEARAAIELALEIFPRVNFDLIYARPGQTALAWEVELTDALNYKTEHLSVYQLTVEQGTAFASFHRQGTLVLPDEEVAADLFDLTQQNCRAAGLNGYEISNHAIPGKESRHNLLYWRYGDYAGVGPGAHGRLTLDGRRVATESERLPERWASRVASNGQGFSCFKLTSGEAAREHLLMNLRISEGVDLPCFDARWGVMPSPERMSELQTLGLTTLQDGKLRITAPGRLVLNSITRQLTDSLQQNSAGRS
jgi:putative oxygen-independent coproporphyrinogen III oxidase